MRRDILRILVDADACPVKQIVVHLAKQYCVPVFMISDSCHQWQDDYSTVIVVDKGKDSVDIYLVNLIQPEDLVITQDFGVAAMALAKHAKAINQNGLIYQEQNMDRLLFERFLNQKMRRSNGRNGKNRKRTDIDDKNFERVLLSFLKKQ